MFHSQANPIAAEYHSTDYDWQQHAEQTTPLVEAQWAGTPAAVREAAVLNSAGRPLSAVAQLLQQLKLGSHNGSISSAHKAAAQASSTFSSAVVTLDKVEAAASPAPAASQGTPHDSGSSSDSTSDSSEQNEWEVFYRAHPAAKFFKERRYLLLEFPCLAPPAQLQHVVEIGAGCGSSILPGRFRCLIQSAATCC